MQAVKRILILAGAALLAVSTTAAASEPPRSPRVQYDFNPGWKVLVGDPSGAEAVGFDDAAWKRVTLPYAWNEDDAFKLAINRVRTGVAWYRKTFKLPREAAGQKVFLEFEGVRQAGEVWLNGRRLGLHENGITAFGFDITAVAKPYPQENVLAVRTDSAYNYVERATGTGFQWNHTSFNVSYGGIPKNVKLHVTGRLYQTLPLYTNLGTTGLYIYARDFDIPGKAATIHAES